MAQHTNTGGDLVSTWATTQRRACRGPDHLVNPVWENHKRQRRAFRSSRLIPARRCTDLLMGQASAVREAQAELARKGSVIHISLSSRLGHLARGIRRSG